MSAPIPRLCALGLHRWRLLAATGARTVRTKGGHAWVGSVTRKCDRCPATRHEQHTRVPLRTRRVAAAPPPLRRDPLPPEVAYLEGFRPHWEGQTSDEAVRAS